jgi:AcrR family transcriptional regulator
MSESWGNRTRRGKSAWQAPDASTATVGALPAETIGLALQETDRSRIAGMPKKKLQPSPAMLLQMEQALFTHGYSGLTMEQFADACDFSRRALYFYFSNKQEVFRAIVRFRNELGLTTGFASGRKRWSEGGNALEILAEIINIRYGDLRRIAHTSPHLVELNSEVFRRCNDIVRDVAIYFESELAKLVLELQRDGLLQLRPDVTAEQLAQALANGARGVNQRVPAVAPDELEYHYRDMCRFILYGCAEMAVARSRTERGGGVRGIERKRT